MIADGTLIGMFTPGQDFLIKTFTVPRGPPRPLRGRYGGGALSPGLGPGRGTGLRPLVAHCHLGLGKLNRRTGKREQAREHLTTARTMYREMDMRYWLVQTEAESMELGA